MKFGDQPQETFGGHDVTDVTIEIGDPDRAGSWPIWVVSKRDSRQRGLLPTATINGGSNFPLGRFIFSPDNRTIVADRKVCSGVNEAFVFECVHGLNFRLADRESLNLRIGKRFRTPKGSLGENGDAGVEFVLFQRWLQGGRYAVLSCHYGDRNSDDFYLVTLDTQSGRLFNYHSVSRRDISTRYVG